MRRSLSDPKVPARLASSVQPSTPSSNGSAPGSPASTQLKFAPAPQPGSAHKPSSAKLTNLQPMLLQNCSSCAPPIPFAGGSSPPTLAHSPNPPGPALLRANRVRASAPCAPIASSAQAPNPSSPAQIIGGSLTTRPAPGPPPALSSSPPNALSTPRSFRPTPALSALCMARQRSSASGSTIPPSLLWIGGKNSRAVPLARIQCGPLNVIRCFYFLLSPVTPAWCRTSAPRTQKITSSAIFVAWSATRSSAREIISAFSACTATPGSFFIKLSSV